MLRSTRSSSSRATFAYSTLSWERGSSPICCTRLLAAVIGLRISWAIEAESSSRRWACSSLSWRRSRVTPRCTRCSTSSVIMRSRRPGATIAKNQWQARPMPQAIATIIAARKPATNSRNAQTET